MIKRLLLSGAVVLALGGVAHAQANNSNTWATPGNQTVGGAVQLCPRASDGVAIPCSNTGSGAVAGSAGYPPGATPIAANAAGTTGAVQATLAAAAGKFTYICGYQINADATGAIVINTSLVGTVATLSFAFGAPAAPAMGNNQQTFTPCIPSSAVNTAIAVNSSAAGAGGANIVSAWGFQL